MMQYTPLAFALLSIVIGSQRTSSADESEDEKPVLRVVLFTPSDVEPPDGVRDRLNEHVEYSQMFYAKWMKRWGYECDHPVPVNLDQDEHPEILYVKGRHDEASGAYRQLGFEREVVETACRKYEIDADGQVWWIFMYKGPKNRGFRGGGNAARGGIATAIYDPSVEGHLGLKDQLGGAASTAIKSKAAIHELGHAFGLPHNGPHQSDELGNSLMGPIIRAYQTRYPDEERVYLTEASAAMLWKHPLFSGTTKDHQVVPRLALTAIEFSQDAERGLITVKGKVESDYKAHSVIVANESRALRSDYWRKCFVGRIAEDGSFEVQVSESDKGDGQLKIVCCFNNGTVIGKERGFGLSSGFIKQYKATREGYAFVDGWSASDANARGGRGQGPGQPRRRPRPQ